jgi:hypothetical protein
MVCKIPFMYTTGWSGRPLVGAMDGCAASFLWHCKDHPMDGTLRTLNQMFFLEKPSIGWSSGRANLKKHNLTGLEPTTCLQQNNTQPKPKSRQQNLDLVTSAVTAHPQNKVTKCELRHPLAGCASQLYQI